MNINDTIEITYNEFSQRSFLFVFDIVWASIFSTYYLQTDNIHNKHYSSILLFIMLIMSYINCIYSLLRTSITYSLIGTTLFRNEYFEKIYFDRTILSQIEMIKYIISTIVLILLIPIFNPFTQNTQKNCHNYSGGLCVCGKILSGIGILNSITIFILLIISCTINTCRCLYVICLTRRNITDNSNLTRDIATNNIYMHQIRSVFEYVNVTDTICSICMETGLEGNDNFVKLPCGHTFHTICIDSWIVKSKNKQCPSCNQEINSNAKNFHQEEILNEYNIV